MIKGFHKKCICWSACLVFVVALMPCCAYSQGHRPLTPQEVNRLFAPAGAYELGGIPKLLSRGSGNVRVPCILGVPQIVVMSPTDTLNMLARESDLVVMGKAEKSSSYMLPNKGFLYSKTAFVVNDVIKNNPKAPVEASSAIIVVRPGGALRISGRMVYAICSDFQLFHAGQDYLLYLHYIAQNGEYRVQGPNGFKFTGSKAFGLGKQGTAHQWLRSFVGMDQKLLLKMAKETAGSYPVKADGQRRH